MTIKKSFKALQIKPDKPLSPQRTEEIIDEVMSYKRGEDGLLIGDPRTKNLKISHATGHLLRDAAAAATRHL